MDFAGVAAGNLRPRGFDSALSAPLYLGHGVGRGIDQRARAARGKRKDAEPGAGRAFFKCLQHAARALVCFMVGSNVVEHHGKARAPRAHDAPLRARLALQHRMRGRCRIARRLQNHDGAEPAVALGARDRLRQAPLERNRGCNGDLNRVFHACIVARGHPPRHRG